MNTKRIIYRPVAIDDLEELVKLEQAVWGEEMGADRDKWDSRFNIFSEGIQVAENKNGLVGVIVSHRLVWDYPIGYFPSWSEATADGFITNHSGSGNCLYGVDLSVLPQMPGVASNLLKFVFTLKKKKNIEKGMMGSRIPSLRRRTKNLTSEEINKNMVLRMAEKDMEVKFFIHNGFRIISARQDYFPEDRESLGWGIILEYTQ